jgi:hypothetical protein
MCNMHRFIDVFGRFPIARNGGKDSKLCFGLSWVTLFAKTPWVLSDGDCLASVSAGVEGRGGVHHDDGRLLADEVSRLIPQGQDSRLGLNDDWKAAGQSAAVSYGYGLLVVASSILKEIAARLPKLVLFMEGFALELVELFDGLVHGRRAGNV